MELRLGRLFGFFIQRGLSLVGDCWLGGLFVAAVSLEVVLNS